MKILTLARDLRRRKARERRALLVAEGVRTVEELLKSTLQVRSALIGPQLRGSARGTQLLAALASRGIPTEEVTAAEFDSAAETDSPQGVLAIGVAPAMTLTSYHASSHCVFWSWTPFRTLVTSEP